MLIIEADDGTVTVRSEQLRKNEIFVVMLASGMREAREQRVKLPGHHKAAVEMFVRLLEEGGCVRLDLENSMKVWRLARFLNQQEMVQAAEQTVRTTVVERENFATLFAFALREDVAEVREHCLNFLTFMTRGETRCGSSYCGKSIQRRNNAYVEKGRVLLLQCNCGSMLCPSCLRKYDRNNVVCSNCTAESVRKSQLCIIDDTDKLSVAGRLLQQVAQTNVSLLDFALPQRQLSAKEWKALLQDCDWATLSDGQLSAISQLETSHLRGVLFSCKVDENGFWNLMQRDVVSGRVATALLALCSSPTFWWEKEAKWLISHRGAVIDEAFADNGANPLHAASFMGLDKVVSFLLSNGASVDCRCRWFETYQKATALHIAAGRGHAKVVEKLLAAGADSSLWDGSGRTVSAVAFYNGHHSISAMLQRTDDDE